MLVRTGHRGLASGGTGVEYDEASTVSTYSSYRVHTWPVGTHTDTFTTWEDLTVDLLILGGGGGGGASETEVVGYNMYRAGGGGGGGAMRVHASYTLSPGTYTVVVGDGGDGGPDGGTNNATDGDQGLDSSFGALDAEGGGGGGQATGDSYGNGVEVGYTMTYDDNGSSGGAGGGSPVTPATGGSYGNNGGSGHPGQQAEYSWMDPSFEGEGGGGGGAGGNGSNGNTEGPGAAGPGLANAFQTGTNITYGLGRPGGSDNANQSQNPTSDGDDTKGEGGEGASADSSGWTTAGGDGGSGTVILRYVPPA